MQSYILTDEQINEIRNSVDIVEIISSYIPLTTRGKNFFGICPFHSDHSPSMSVSKEKQIYTCFSCGASGNVFKFIMDYENITFIEAVKICANKAGLHLNIETKDNHVDINKELYDIFELTQKFYVNNINTNLGLEAKDYLKNRQIDLDCIKEFGIGLSLTKTDLLTNLLINKKYNPKTIEKTGLIIKKDSGYTDTYINRIMFPLYDLTGKIVGYSGRIYNTISKSKYFNIKETDIFKKGELLYNYHKAKESVRKENKLIIVEGFMDVIRMHTIGITNVVATMGTAVTKNQALLMKRLSQEIILCFDGDSAGNEATMSCINELNKIGIVPKVVRLEDNLDPDEYILKNGKNKFIEKLNNPINCMEYKMNFLKQKKDLTNNFDMANYVDSVINELSKINNDTYIELSLKKLSNESNLSVEYLKEKISKKEKIIIKEPNKNIKISKYDIAERNLIYYMLNNKEVVKLYNKYHPIFTNDEYRLLSREISVYYKEKGNVNLADLLTFFNNDENVLKIINKLLLVNLKDNYTIEEIKDYIKLMRKNLIEKEINNMQQKIKLENDSIKKAQYLEEIIKYKKMEEEEL